ncbi:hypothetical protein N7465_009659 [Penicillium sp. CMV-2018d]|nr:hypothetical protein N7465_009659 [Penicillium sp. CMV-2018d]
MPSNTQRPGWTLCLRLSLFFLFGLLALAVVFVFQYDGSPGDAAASAYNWADKSGLPFHIDSDTWAMQHRNHTQLHRRATDVNQDQDYSCAKDKPCSNGACCGESGVCGYGSTYCGTGCTSNCDAKAPCGENSESGDAKCPLNVCCSQFGFCGTTSDFCGGGCQSNCRTPASPSSGGDVRNTIIGYYESWKAAESSTDPVDIAQLPVEALNGLSYAFAYITSGTYEIVPMPGNSKESFSRVADAKKRNPELRVWLSIGGWTFSDNGTSTQSLFGEIAADTQNRAKFADNLYKFMVQYGFSGVDLDWEYPGAGDRGGLERDVTNYPLLLKEIRSVFAIRNRDFKISFTAPSSYWYLQWFDLPELVKWADYINLMTYDLHGVWDQHDPFGSHIYAHTNLTEIEGSLSLLWRNNISPSKVNLGLAFYGRTFDLEDPSCFQPGCLFSGAGAKGGKTDTAGILSFGEIQDIIADNDGSIFTTYDNVAGVNYMVYNEGKSWVSFDDKTTFQQKIEFANARGLNGLFIWAIDLDDDNFTALKSVTGTDLTPIVRESSTLSYFNIDKCYNARCGLDCVEGFTTMGQIEMAQDTHGEGGSFNGCIAGRKQVFCCDPPFNGTAFLPVALDRLFPGELPAADPPVYYESFDHTARESEEQYPKYDGTFTDDPNGEPFAWTIMVGSESDVQSLRKRDGSHLEAFDCPSPAKDDYNVQTFKTVCTVDNADNNCEDITLGSVHGTIIRLPEECGPDEWVRVVSFKQLDEHPIPAKFEKRIDTSPKVYEIKYDYNLRQLRRGGGEVYVRFDASTHPGYWDEVVASSPSGSLKRRSPTEWRESNMDWFEQHRIHKRGYSTSDNWWLTRFNNLLDAHSNYGIKKDYHFEQLLYNAAKPCPPLTASLTAKVAGDLSVRLDYGISLIGTLRNFDLSEAYAFFNLDGLQVDTMASIDANAAFKYESQKLQMLDTWDPFAGSFNIKGLWTVGPYFDATAQIQGLATVSGKVSSGMTFTTGDKPFSFMFPQSLNKFPSSSIIDPGHLMTKIETYTAANISADGSITLTMVPSVGFQIQLDAFGEKLVNTRVSSSFSNAMTLRVGAGTGSNSLCGGATYGVDYSLDIDISVENPLPGWDSGAHSVNIYGIDKELSPKKCYPWNSSTEKRAVGMNMSNNASSVPNLTRGLTKRGDETSDTVLFPDILGGALRCPKNTNTPSGDCNRNIDFDDDEDSVFSKRDEDSLHVLDRRAKVKEPAQFCQKKAKITTKAPAFDPSGDLIKAAASHPFSTYGPLNPDDCTDYSFGRISTPAESESAQYATEHVLEWQMYKSFWVKMTEGVNKVFEDPRSQTFIDKKFGKRKDSYTGNVCQYYEFWWQTFKLPYKGEAETIAINEVAKAYPSDVTFRSELMLLEGNVNGIKKLIWDSQASVIRKSDKMALWLRGNGKTGTAKRDYNDAINSCKRALWAMQYVTTPAVSDVLVEQVTRVGEYFDEVEQALHDAPLNPKYNAKKYIKQNFGDKWRDYMYEQWSLAVKKQQDFIATEVPKMNTFFNYVHGGDATNADPDGDTEMGGTEDNTEVVDRLKALNDAVNSMTKDPPNPFPANWQL